MIFVVFLIISYFIGAIPFCFILGKARGVDITKTGSGNSGATNLTRSLGPVFGAIGYILDALKGVFMVAIFPGTQVGEAAAVGLMAVLGHIFPVYTRKGGKGVATGGGVFAVFSLWGFVIALIVWLLIVARTHYVSLGSIVAAGVLPAYQLASGDPFSGDSAYVTALSILIFFIIVITHRDNIKRLLRGQERKLSLKK